MGDAGRNNEEPGVIANPVQHGFCSVILGLSNERREGTLRDASAVAHSGNSEHESGQRRVHSIPRSRIEVNPFLLTTRWS